MKKLMQGLLTVASLTACGLVLAADNTGGGTGNIGQVAANVTSTMENLAKLITAASYVIGMALVVAAIVKFKAYKDAPTQVPLGTPIAMLFIGAALIFVPTVFKVGGGTLFGASGVASSVSGISDFGKKS